MNLTLVLILFEHSTSDCHAADHAIKLHVQGSDCMHLLVPWEPSAIAFLKPC